MWRGIFILGLVLANVSCANYLKRKSCEKQNWFEYGKSVALKGQRLGSDKLFNECIKVNAEFDEGQADLGFKKGMDKYCVVETSYEYGLKGKAYNFTFCESPHEKKMRSLHAKGVNEYCQPNNGYPQGIKGVPYNGICPKSMESAFLVGFNKGRVKYLKSEITSNRQAINDINSQIRGTQQSMNRINRNIRYLPRTQVTTYEKDANGKIQKMVKESEEVAIRRRSLNNELATKRRQMDAQVSQQQLHREKIRNFEKEISLLQ